MNQHVMQLRHGANSPASIHPNAQVDPAAVIGLDCSVGPYAVIGPDVVLGPRNKIQAHAVLNGAVSLESDNTIYPYAVIDGIVQIGCSNTVESHACISGRTILGSNNKIGAMASIGGAPQCRGDLGLNSNLVIGDNNIIFERVTIHRGTDKGSLQTRIGNDNILMVDVHVAHDVSIGNSNTLVNSCQIAGHVKIGNFVNIGGMNGIHQYVRIGDYAFISARSIVERDIPPFCIGANRGGERAVLVGINTRGMMRNGLGSAEQQIAKRVFRELFIDGKPRDEVRGEFQELFLETLFTFLESESKRGISPASRKR